MLTRRHLYYAHILPFSLLPSKDQVGKIIYKMLLLGKGKLRKRVYVHIASPHSWIYYLQSHILDKFICNAKKSVLWGAFSHSQRHVVQNGEKLAFPAHAFPAEVKQGSDLLSCFDFHVVNKCTFHDVCHI